MACNWFERTYTCMEIQEKNSMEVRASSIFSMELHIWLVTAIRNSANKTTTVD